MCVGFTVALKDQKWKKKCLFIYQIIFHDKLT